MGSRPYRRSISFEILANNSPGDGDSFVAGDANAIGDEKAEGKIRRRRRKRRSRKMTLGDLSPLLPLDEEFSSIPRSPLRSMYASNTQLLPLEGPSPALGSGPSRFSSDRHNGDFSTEPWPLRSAFSTDGLLASTSSQANSRTSNFGPDLQDGRPLKGLGFDGIAFDDGGSAGEFMARETSSEVSLYRNEEASSSRDAQLRSEYLQNFPVVSEEGSSYSSQAAQKFYIDLEILKKAAEFPKQGSRIHLVSVSERVLKPQQPVLPKPPDFSVASEGLAEPRFARLVEKTSDKEGEKSSPGVASGERSQRSPSDSNTSTFSDEHGTPQAQKVRLGTFATPQMKDWERLMALNAADPPPFELSPIQYLVKEILSGSTLRNTTSVGTEQKRERVYNTMFHVPWRCELLIDIGFIVCLDALLSLFTVMPARIVMFIWQRFFGLLKGRQLQRPFGAELCDFGCLIVLVVGVAILMQADISIIYHWIRGQGVIKLYVVFNVLEIFDKLCQSFGADVLQVLFNSAVSVECCKSERLSKEIARFAFDEGIAIFCFFVHSLVIISQAITISAAVNAQNNALLTLLISNNFAEIKGNVFKRMGRDQLHKMAYHDTVERFHIMTHVLFVWAQNVLNGEDSLWLKFIYNAGMVFVCEVTVDVIKHSFLAKFNEVKPAAYSEFLQALCSQTLNSQSHEVHKTLTFVPLAPACVVIRILLPVCASWVPEAPIWWRWPCILLLGGTTYFTLVLFKVVVGLGLQYHAKWYLNRHPWTTSHPHFE